MATRSQSTFKRCIGAASLALLLSACQFRPSLLAASAVPLGNDTSVHVVLRSADAKTITSREPYFSIIVFNCGEDRSGYPMEPLINGVRMSGFNLPTSGEHTVISGHVPTWIFKKYKNPCAYLRGGSYLAGTIESTQIAIRTGA